LLADINAEADSRLHQAVLIGVLGRLVGNGLVGPTPVAAYPPEVHYWLTEYGHGILSAVMKLGLQDPWVRRNADSDDERPVRGVDPRRPNPARIWNWNLGGQDNFQADREAGSAVLAAMPSLAITARLTRQFQAAAVRSLLELGVRQFIDIGTGLPVAGAVHEVAQRAFPESRVVYVDNDPVVLAHARALLNSTPEGACSYVQADLRDPSKILRAAAETLDLGRPTAILLMMVLHFVPDSDDPAGIVRRLLDGIRGPAYLVVAHAAADTAADEAAEAAREYNARSPVPVRLRSHEEVAAFYAGATILPPGLITLGEWTSLQAPDDTSAGLVNGHVGIGRRPPRDSALRQQS
jgi:hypothetical protein